MSDSLDPHDVPLPTPEQLFGEAKRIAKEDRDKSVENRFREHISQVVWEWPKPQRSESDFDFDGYIMIVATSYEEGHAYSRTVQIGYETTIPWIRPDHLTIMYIPNNYVTTRVQFVMRNQSLLACTHHPTESLSNLLERLDLASARVSAD